MLVLSKTNIPKAEVFIHNYINCYIINLYIINYLNELLKEIDWNQKDAFFNMVKREEYQRRTSINIYLIHLIM